MAAHTGLFPSNRSQAVRRPRAVAFADSVPEMLIIRDGPRRIIASADAAWDDFFDAPGIDLGARQQPAAQDRDEFRMDAICWTRISASVSHATDPPVCDPGSMRKRAGYAPRRSPVRAVFRRREIGPTVRNRNAVERFAARLIVLPFDSAAAAHAADIRAALDRQGKPIAAYELMIAGHSRSKGLIVVTGNLREFNRVEGCAQKTGWPTRSSANGDRTPSLRSAPTRQSAELLNALSAAASSSLSEREALTTALRRNSVIRRTRTASPKLTCGRKAPMADFGG